MNIGIFSLTSPLHDEQSVGKMTDAHYLYTEIPVFASKGRLQLSMEPRSFLMIDL